MRVMPLAVFAAVAFALAAVPAEAAKRKRSQAVAEQSGRGEAGVVVRRSRTRITVTQPLYLDARTEVDPGTQNYTGYVFAPNYDSPASFILGPGRRDGEPTPGTTPF